MNMHAKTAILATAALLATALVLPGDVEAASPPTMKFGMDAYSIPAQTDAGVKPDYATLWVGPWNLNNWGGVDSQLDRMRNAGVTPAIHFYYWGDDISVSCIEKGCWSSLHGTHKDQAGWQKLAEQLNARLHAKMAGKQVVILLESEFNKGNVATYENLDGLLASKAKYFKGAYPNSKVVLALGNWNSAAWGTWDRAAAASDMIGLQGMRGSTRDSLSYYQRAYEDTLAGAKTAKAKFGKPVFVTDIALSSYPDSTYLAHQNAELKQFFGGMGELKAAGVQAFVYRSWRNSDNMDTANYYGIAERHWGLAYSSGTLKASGHTWIAGVKAERSGTSSSTGTSTGTSTGSGTVTFTPTSSGNEWWVETKVSGMSPTKVEAKSGTGSWHTLSKTSYGTWAKSFHAPKGSTVTFRATDAAGNAATKDFTWGSASTTAFSVTWSPKSVGNDWWVETAASGSGISKVETRVNGGSWTSLPKTSWGTYAKSVHAPDNAKVEFRATSTTGSTSAVKAYTWT